MKEDILEDILNDVLKEQAKIIKKIDLLNSTNSDSITTVIEPRELEISENSFNRLKTELKSGADTLIEVVNRIPLQNDKKNVLEHKVVLFSTQYDEGEYGIKTFFRWLLGVTIICVIIFSSIKYLPAHYVRNSKNQIYAKTLFWYYYQMSKKNQLKINGVYKRFEEGDTTLNNQLKTFMVQQSLRP
jgi:hypothetical protein